MCVKQIPESTDGLTRRVGVASVAEADGPSLALPQSLSMCVPMPTDQLTWCIVEADPHALAVCVRQIPMP